jgi:hypothetical protein
MVCQITVLITNVKSISNVYKKDKLKLINGDTINEVTIGEVLVTGNPYPVPMTLILSFMYS